MSDASPPPVGDTRVRSHEDQRLLAGVCLFTIYVVVAPLLASLLVWAFNMLFIPRGGFLDLGHSFAFWLFVAFVGAAPVLFLTAIVHFIARFRPFRMRAAAVLAAGVVGWIILALIVEPREIIVIVLYGLAVLCCAFLLVHWGCSSTTHVVPPQTDPPRPLD